MERSPVSTNMARRERSVISSTTIRCLVRQEQRLDIYIYIYMHVCIRASFHIHSQSPQILFLISPRSARRSRQWGRNSDVPFPLLDLIFMKIVIKNKNNNKKLYKIFKQKTLEEVAFIYFIYLFHILLLIVVYLTDC